MGTDTLPTDRLGGACETEDMSDDHTATSCDSNRNDTGGEVSLIMSLPGTGDVEGTDSTVLASVPIVAVKLL